jgi:predicted transposase YbfD/YdcC
MPYRLECSSLRATVNEYFGAIPDPRVERTRAHHLVDIITIALLAILSGADGWNAIETYGWAKQEWLESFLDLPNGIPSHDTFARVFARLDPNMLESQFQEWVKLLASYLGATVIAIDGKSIKGSYDREMGVKALQLVSAWASEHQLVLGQCAVETKSNEITAIPILLEQLDLSGSIITIDAMGTQTSIAQQIYQAKADYILSLKTNHPRLAHAAQRWFEDRKPSINSTTVTQTTTVDAGHHRIETRTVWQVCADQVFSPSQLNDWAGLKTLVVVESVRRLWNKETREIRFFISSLADDTPSLGQYIRSHWGIENQLHWCLDVTFAEDKSRIRKDHAPRNISLLRRFSLNLLRQETSKLSLKMKRYKAAMDNQFLLKVLADAGMISTAF